MHYTTATGAIAGVVAAVPAQRLGNDDMPNPEHAHAAARGTGVLERRRRRPHHTAANLCADAARLLLQRLGWAPDSIGVLVYVTQTPVEAIPADAFSIAADLGLPAACAVVQANYSCSGYVYGLWLAQRLRGTGQRALLLVGDTISELVDDADRATAPLFGDAGSATAIDGGAVLQSFWLGQDGTGAAKLCTEGGKLRMDGAEVFGFTLRHVVPMLRLMLTGHRPTALLMHQANAMMLAHLRNKVSALIPEGCTVYSNVREFGNTSCASIPLLMATTMQPQRDAVLAMAGYGAGWAWAGTVQRVPDLRVCELLEVA